MFCRFRVQPAGTICVVEHGVWPRGIKAGAARTATETLIYDFGLGLTWLDWEHHRPATVLEHHTQEYHTHNNLGKRIQDCGGRLH